MVLNPPLKRHNIHFPAELSFMNKLKLGHNELFLFFYKDVNEINYL